MSVATQGAGSTRTHLQLGQVLEHAVVERLLGHTWPQGEHALECQLSDVCVGVHETTLGMHGVRAAGSELNTAWVS